MIEQPGLFDPVQGMALRPPPIVGTDDPPNSHLAAALVEPTRGTKRAAVLAVLRAERARANCEGWVPGERLRNVGGSEALRRVRELGQMGWTIDRRHFGGNGGKGSGGWYYRLAAEPQESGAGASEAR